MSGVAVSDDPKPDRSDHRSGFEEDAILELASTQLREG
jgi:hypothetical protein